MRSIRTRYGGRIYVFRQAMEGQKFSIFSRFIMQRSPRVNKGVSSQNYEEFDDALMKRARDLRWLFVKKGDTEPIVIGYNSVMWPKEMTARQKLNLETKP